MATIGRNAAVTELPNGAKFKGVLAWYMWLALHLAYIIGFRSRVAVLVNWIWSYHLRPPRPHHRGRGAVAPPGPRAASPAPAHPMSGEPGGRALRGRPGHGISVWSARSTARLQNELEERRRQASKEELVEAMSRYREPLLRAAFDLQSRIYNIVGQGSFTATCSWATRPTRSTPAATPCSWSPSTWVEILRRGVQFLDLGDVRRNQLLVERLEAIGTILSTDRQFQGGPAMFRGEQRRWAS